MSADLRTIEGGGPVRQQAAAWFARLRADDVTEAQTRQWQGWLDADPRHREAYERIERLWSALGEHAPEPEITGRLTSATRAGTSSWGRKAWLPWAGAVAAMVVFAIGIWGVLRPAEPGRIEYATAVGEHRSMVLEDGSRITLDTDSRLSVAYTSHTRDITLERGRAFFHVVSDPRPLSVHTAHGSVRAIGTEFEVSRLSNALEVSLVEGRVTLLPATSKYNHAPATMQAGHRARLNADLATFRIEAMNPAPPAWLSGRLVFVNVSLDEVASEFGRYSHQALVLDGDSLDDIRISGVFRSDGLQAFVGALSDAYPIGVDTSTPGVLRLHEVQAPASRE